MKNTSRFVFSGYEYSTQKTEIFFRYEVVFDKEIFHFIDTLVFPKSFSHVSEKDLKPFLDNLLLILGISYWKIFCPKTIETPTLDLSKKQADFWDMVYTKGLGEFFYENKIDFRGLIQFPYEEENIQAPVELSPQDRSLVPIGGGKDGIVVAELLKTFNKPFSTLLIYTNIEKSTAQEEVTQEIGQEIIRVHHTLDPQITDLNKREDAYNGHVPMVAMHSFIELLTAFLYDYKYIVMGNEESANYGNVEYLGEVMNHQWSKSLEFEELFHKYVQENIARDISSFSLLRPFSEIKIAQLFSTFPQYFSHFVSCNRGFTKAKNGETGWCRECPKCAFVFVLLGAFLPKEKVIGIFGKNLFEDTTLIRLYKELLGLESFKPFECVGTPEETTLAFYYAWKRREWNDTSVMQFFMKSVLPTLKNIEELEDKLFAPATNHIPKEFERVLSL